MLANKVTAEWVEVPHEPGNEFKLGALSWAQLKEAKSDKRKEAFDLMREMGADLLAATPKATPEDRAEARKASAEDPLEDYSIETLLRFGLIDWRGPGYEGADVSEASQLDEETVNWAARAILARSRIERKDEGKSRASSAPSTTAKA